MKILFVIFTGAFAKVSAMKRMGSLFVAWVQCLEVHCVVFHCYVDGHEVINNNRADLFFYIGNHFSCKRNRSLGRNELRFFNLLYVLRLFKGIGRLIFVREDC